uniref:Uncharacterized protein n=1 Tax=Streptomyces sp. NBC_00003 TaxID=2903608 RepID=A0AAU2VFK1_9ACTN
MCTGTADAALLVDVTILSPMSGLPDDRTLRPFCEGCYNAMTAMKNTAKELKKLKRKLT